MLRKMKTSVLTIISKAGLMSSIRALCLMGMHLQTIWAIANQSYLSLMPFNPVVRVSEAPWISSTGMEFGLQLKIDTRNGFNFIFCFDTLDRALRFAFVQEFPIGTSLNTGTCHLARIKMVRAGINHRFYMKGQRIYVLISCRDIDLGVFVRSDWEDFVFL